MEKEKINFRPLHEGMGFHPFSDGLPYAPESKNKYQNGTGATAAGRPQFVTQTTAHLPIQNKSTVKTIRQLQEQQPKVSPQNSLPTTKVVSQKLTQVKPTTEAVNRKTMPTSSLLRRRMFAYLMDTVIHAGFWLSANLAALFFFKFQLDSEIIKENFAQFLIFFTLSQWLFIALQEVLFENTIGKVFFNLEFKRNHSSLFIRSFVFMLGLMAAGTGLYYRSHDRFGEIKLKNNSDSNHHD